MAREIKHRKTGETLLCVEAASLEGASLRNLDLRGADLRRENLTGAVLTGSKLDGADLTGVRLDGAQLALACLDRAELRNSVLAGATMTRASLRGTDLEGVHLADAVLKAADLTGANLTEAYLCRVNLAAANLSRCVLAGAYLEAASLTEADLTDACYDYRTHWPAAFDPQRHGAILMPRMPQGERLPEYRARLEPITASERQREPPEVGQRTKLGGDPDWIQAEQIPECPDCQRPMSFVAQIDAPDERYMFGDAGLIYVFYCADCYQTASVLQFS